MTRFSQSLKHIYDVTLCCRRAHNQRKFRQRFANSGDLDNFVNQLCWHVVYDKPAKVL